jgi:shikimate O-hydroxycinnamoyltransferase
VAGIQFINTISDFARGAPVTVTPWVDRALLRARNPPTPKFLHVEYLPAPGLLPRKSNGTDFSPSLTNANRANFTAPESISNGVKNGVHAASDKTNGTNFTAPESKSNGVINGDHAAGDKVAVAPLECAVVVLSIEKLAILKRKVLSKENSIRYSTYEILSAHIWKCVTRARELDGAQPTKLYVVIDGRARLVPPVPQDYFGNVVFHTTPMSTAGEIVHHPLSYAAGKIHDALARMDDEYLKSALDYLEMQPDRTKVVRNAHSGGDPNLSITSWTRLPIYDCDFGWGRPIFMGPARINYDGIVHILPSPVNDGSLTLSVGMRSDYMHKFQELILNVEDAK